MIGRSNRFHGHGSLRFVYQRGKSVRGELMALKFALNERRTVYRCAVVVSRKVSKSAVVRNRIRRRIYEIVRLQGNSISKPYDLVFTVFDEQAANLPAAELESLVLHQLKSAGILSGSLPKHTKTLHGKIGHKEN